MAVVFGSVQLSDGSSFRLLEPLADINVFGKVVVLDEKRNETTEVLVNNFGEYLIPRVPANAHVFLAARVEGGEGLQEILSQAHLAGAPAHRIDLTIRNTPPRVAPLVLRHGSGDPVDVAKPGETLKVNAAAVDKDGDAVAFRWLVDTGSGSLNATTGSDVEWTLPATDGFYSLTMIASDRKGGFDREYLSVRADT